MTMKALTAKRAIKKVQIAIDKISDLHDKGYGAIPTVERILGQLYMLKSMLEWKPGTGGDK